MILRAGFLLAVCLVSAATAANVPRLPPAAAGFDPARLSTPG
jgi:hypothetical protein